MNNIKYLYKFLIVGLFSAYLCSCTTSNIFEANADKTTDEAIIEEAKKKTDELDYDGAITLLASLTDNAKATDQVKRMFAGAYAGKCGFNFVDYVQAIGSSPSGALLLFLMAAWDQEIVTPDHCTTSESYIKSIGATSEARTSDDNFFMAILSMAKIGVYLRNKADIDSTDNLGDGTADAGFNYCLNDPSYFTDDEIKEVMTGMSLMINNIDSVIASIGSGGAAGSVGALAAACDALGTPSPCDYENAEDITDPLLILAMRTLIQDNSMGIGPGGLPCTP